tara:strand:- start:635 stop:760 length:126 start_codon:yes stop_codon:yes gene_type:complete
VKSLFARAPGHRAVGGDGDSGGGGDGDGGGGGGSWVGTAFD